MSITESTVKVKVLRTNCPDCGREFHGSTKKRLEYNLALHQFAAHKEKKD